MRFMLLHCLNLPCYHRGAWPPRSGFCWRLLILYRTVSPSSQATDRYVTYRYLTYSVMHTGTRLRCTPQRCSQH
ncbi:hypothetical protein BDR03DRAFT_950735 [Suillus americanus]|nr:hypothetical protein BDR03DRAFT_950735 [Suillus americanus]